MHIPDPLTPAMLVATRRSLTLSQEDLAELLSVRRESVARWESGDRPIPAGLRADLQQLAAKFIEDVELRRRGGVEQFNNAYDYWRNAATFWAWQPELATSSQDQSNPIDMPLSASKATSAIRAYDPDAPIDEIIQLGAWQTRRHIIQAARSLTHTVVVEWVPQCEENIYVAPWGEPAPAAGQAIHPDTRRGWRQVSARKV